MRAPAIAALLSYLLFASGCAHVLSDDTLEFARDNAVDAPSDDAGTRHDRRRAQVVIPATFKDPLPGAPQQRRYLLDTGDQIRVLVYGEPNLSRHYIVGHDGKISIPLIGNVMARKKTVGQLKNLIAARLGARYVRDPQVSVDVVQNRPFYILGEVRSAGQYPFASGMTVQTAVAIAGGYTERADETGARLTRRINGFVEEIEAPFDYVVRPGDTIYIRERFF